MTPAQKKVIDLMKSGWQLAKSVDQNHDTWLQKGGCGRGGEIKRVHGNTFHALWIAGLIEYDQYDFPVSTYRFKMTKLAAQKDSPK